MRDVQNFDFVVVGAGMAGASAAAFLSECGRVALIEGEQHAGYHSTGRSAALFSELYGSPVIRALTRASRNFLFEPPVEFAATPLVSPRGALYFARPDQMSALESFLEDADVRTVAKRLSGSEVVERVPILRNGHFEGGALDDGAADLDVDAIHQGFLRQVRRHKSEIFLESRVRSLMREGGQWLVSTADASFRAPVVINASGAWGDELAALARVAPVGLQPMRRTAVLIPTPFGLSAEHWPAAIDISEQFYFKPDAGLLMLSPADEHPCGPCDAQPEELDVAIAVDLFEKATDSQVRQIRRSWAGLRVFSPDRSPVVGFDPAAEGFFWLVGQGGYGIQTAPALGRVAAALASGRAMPADAANQGVTLESLTPARFASAITAHR